MRSLLVVLLCGLGMFAAAGVAAAHPLNNLSINHYDGLRVHPDRLEVLSVVDSAEIPTLQERGPIDARRKCTELTRFLDASADGERLSWSVGSANVEQPWGEANLPTTRLTCELTAPLRVNGPVELTFSDSYLANRPGWREITAVGVGVAVSGENLAAESVSDQLRRHPDDLLSTPLDVRAVRLLAQPGEGTTVLPPTAGPATAVFTGLLGERDLTPWIGILSVLLSLVLGASHAALPGHGKTVMAAYLVGSKGTSRDALLVGATVTLTHTAGVLVLGLALSVSSTLAGDSVMRWLGLASGLIVAIIGGLLFRSAIRRKRHGHGHSHGHSHGHGHRHRRASLLGMGIAGGLVPSPSALVVLLGAVALGRTWFGVLLVLAYGAGMAATLTAAGLLLVKVRDRLERITKAGWLRRLAEFTPVSTAALVVLVGLGLATRALAG